jgi:3-oxoacyl-[acyl-carrier-protein] synthase-3
MGVLVFENVGITGIAAAVPGRIIDNYEFDKYFSKEEIKR